MNKKTKIKIGIVIMLIFAGLIAFFCINLYKRNHDTKIQDYSLTQEDEEETIDWDSVIEKETESVREVDPETTDYDGITRAISFWGDSMTEGIGDEIGGIVMLNGEAYDVTGLASSDTVEYLTGLEVYNMGKVGETSTQIATRQGGLAMYLDETVTITDKPVIVNIVSDSGETVYMDNYNGYGCSSYMYESDIVYINGLRFKVLFDDSGRMYIEQFFGLEDGYNYLYKSGESLDITIGNSYSVTLEKGSVVKTAAAYERAGDILIIEIGSNGGWDSYDELIEQIDAMILANNCDYYIIVGDTDDPGDSIAEWWESEYDAKGEPRGLMLTEWETALEQAYGDHFLNTRLYLIENGLSDCGLEETEEDREGYEYGKISKQLRYDWTHFNAYGYFSQALAIYKKGVELGYWQ